MTIKKVRGMKPGGRIVGNRFVPYRRVFRPLVTVRGTIEAGDFDPGSYIRKEDATGFVALESDDSDLIMLES